MNDAKTITDFLFYAEKLKTEYRLASKSDGLRESVADHCWSLSLLLMLVAPKLTIELDLLHALKMVIVHDLVEVEAHDVPILDHIVSEDGQREKEEKELAAMESIQEKLGEMGDDIYTLWREYEAQQTVEARVVKALDRLDGQLQFLNENVTTFKASHGPAIEALLAQTTKLAQIDPLIAEIDVITMGLRKRRIASAA